MADGVAVSILASTPTAGAGETQEVPVVVSVQPPEGTGRTPCDICCVIDISWSMSMEATVQTGAGQVESNGLSMLDIAKHAVRTVIRSLGPEDRISLVQFCREAEVKLPLTAMTAAGQQTAEEQLDAIGFGSGTALWQGLSRGLDTLRSGASPDRLAHLMLLTDGETEDRDDVMKNLKELKIRHERLPGTISAFGFGYEIDSKLLVEIADFSNGSYAFIPDAGFVGTIFVNSMSNLLVTMARDAWLTIQADFGASIVQVMGGWETRREGEKLLINLGTLQYGQTKDVVVKMNVNPAHAPYLVASLTYATLRGPATVAAAAQPPSDKVEELVQLNWCRATFIEALLLASAAAGEGTEDSLKAAQAVIKEAGAKVAASPAAKTEQGAALLEDILGQSCEALSRTDYWTKWGRHYTPSVMFAHKLEQCNNFKDPGVQFYGGNLFQSLRDEADAAFDRLPAPKVTPAMYRYLGGGKVVVNRDYHGPGATTAAGGRTAGHHGGATHEPARPAPAVSMAAYNDRYGGCICGESEVQLASGEMRRLRDLQKGDRVWAASGMSAEVECLVRTSCSGGRFVLVDLPGGARLTPYHPVYAEGAWRFPVELGEAKDVECEAVYSIILRGASNLLVSGVPCVALGHGLEEGAAKHAYFGSKQVLEDLAKLPGHEAGLVDLPPSAFRRDPETGVVVGLLSVQ